MNGRSGKLPGSIVPGRGLTATCLISQTGESGAVKAESAKRRARSGNYGIAEARQHINCALDRSHGRYRDAEAAYREFVGQKSAESGRWLPNRSRRIRERHSRHGRVSKISNPGAFS